MIKSPLNSTQSLLVIIVSFLLASIVNIYPMSLATSSLRPMALMMVLVFWLIHKPTHIGVIVAFFVGLFADLLLDTRLGQQAFAAAVMAFVVRSICIYLREISLKLVWIVATVALCVFQLTLWAVQYITQNIFIADSFLTLVVSILTWPLVFVVLISFTKQH